MIPHWQTTARSLPSHALSQTLAFPVGDGNGTKGCPYTPGVFLGMERRYHVDRSCRGPRVQCERLDVFEFYDGCVPTSSFNIDSIKF